MRSIGTTLNLGRFEKFRGMLEALPADDPDRICCGLDGCDGYGHVVWEVEGRLASRKCPNLLQSSMEEIIETRMRDHWLDWPPPSFAEFRQASGFVATPSFLAVEKLCSAVERSAPPQALVLCGGHGRGKTLAPLMLIRRCTGAGVKCHAIKFPELIGLYKMGYDGRPALEREFRLMKGAALIYVDEVGREPGGNPEHAAAAVSEIVNLCYRRKYLVLSTNKTKTELGRKEDGYLPTDVRSRLSTPTGYCTTIEEPFGQDLRQQTLL